MTLHLQKYLRSEGSPDSLKRDLGIDHKRHGSHPNLVLFKYNQIESPMANPIVQECRGIILDQDNDWNIVAFGFMKFFNFGEPGAAEIDWDTARVQEKKDGSMILLYFYKGEWFVATTGTPDANTEINGSGITFSKLFWDTIGVDLNTDAQSYNFIFELTSVYNRVVVDHKETELTILGARRVDTWQEVHPSEIKHLFPKMKVIQEYPLQKMDDIFATFDKMNPLEQEGYVIVWDNKDGSKGRNKVKHPGYVILHHAKDNIMASIKNMVNVVRNGESAEYLASFPDLVARMDQIKIRYLELVTHLQECYIQHMQIIVQKDFALAITKHGICRHTGALFALRSGKVRSIREYLSTVNMDVLLRLLGYK